MNRQKLSILSVVLSLVCGCSFSEPTALEIAQRHIGQAEWELALGSSARLIRVDPTGHQGYLLHGRANLALKRLDAAVVDLSRAIRIAPQEPEAYYQRALAHKYLGKPILAAADRQAAHRRDPNFAITFAYTPLDSAPVESIPVESQAPLVDESVQRDVGPASTSASSAYALSLEAEDAQWSAAMFTLIGDDPEQTALPAKNKSSLSAAATKTVAPLDSQDGERSDRPEAARNRPLKEALVPLHDFFSHPHRGLRPGSDLANSRKPLRGTGWAIDVPGYGPRSLARVNSGTINQPSADMNRGKYPIARWQAPGMSAAAGRSASRPAGDRSGTARRGPFAGSGPQGRNSTSRLGGASSVSAGGMTRPARNIFKPVVVGPRRLPAAGNAMCR